MPRDSSSSVKTTKEETDNGASLTNSNGDLKSTLTNSPVGNITSNASKQESDPQGSQETTDEKQGSDQQTSQKTTDEKKPTGFRNAANAALVEAKSAGGFVKNNWKKILGGLSAVAVCALAATGVGTGIIIAAAVLVGVCALAGGIIHKRRQRNSAATTTNSEKAVNQNTTENVQNQNLGRDQNLRNAPGQNLGQNQNSIGNTAPAPDANHAAPAPAQDAKKVAAPAQIVNQAQPDPAANQVVTEAAQTPPQNTAPAPDANHAAPAPAQIVNQAAPAPAPARTTPQTLAGDTVLTTSQNSNAQNRNLIPQLQELWNGNIIRSRHLEVEVPKDSVLDKESRTLLLRTNHINTILRREEVHKMDIVTRENKTYLRLVPSSRETIEAGAKSLIEHAARLWQEHDRNSRTVVANIRESTTTETTQRANTSVPSTSPLNSQRVPGGGTQQLGSS